MDMKAILMSVESVELDEALLPSLEHTIPTLEKPEGLAFGFDPLVTLDNTIFNSGRTDYSSESFLAAAQKLIANYVKNANIDLDANVKKKHRIFSEPLLITAVSKGYIELTSLLLAQGASVNVKDKLGATALMHAAHKGHSQVLALLLAKGANFEGKGPLISRSEGLWGIYP